jgi:TRAP transporter TAXI family solute receptor
MKRDKQYFNFSICIFLPFILCLSLFGYATGAELKKGWPSNLFIEGMAVGSSAYLVTAAFAKSIQDTLGLRCQVTAGTPAPLAATKVGRGQSDLGMVNGDPPYCAFHGLDDWQGKPLKDLRVFTSVMLVPTQFITWPGTGINSVPDLKGKILMGDRKGARFGADAVDGALAPNGLTRNNVKVVSWQEYSEQIAFIRMRLGDAIFISSGVRTAPMMELDRTIKWKFISFAKKEIESILKKGPYFVPFTIPAGSYTQQPQEVHCVAVPTVLVIRAGLPDSLVYELCKILYDVPGKFKSVHPEWGKFDVAFATKARLAPYHSGAVKYYKEKGVWDAELDHWQQETLKAAGLTSMTFH